MEMTREEAAATLREIEAVTEKVRRAVAYSGASPILVLWGLVWMAGYVSTHFFPAESGPVWAVLLCVGGVGSFVLGVRSPADGGEKVDGRLGWFWFVLMGYAVLWIVLLGPAELGRAGGEEVLARKMGAYWATVPMFAYVVGGMWFGRFFFWLGLGVTAATLVGYFALPGVFHLWMAAAGGGALVASGIYIRRCWR